MKTLRVTFTDAEYKKLTKAKRNADKDYNSSLTWHKFLLLKLTKGVSARRNGNR